MTWQVPNLYALAAYDMCEFAMALAETTDEVIEELYTTLTFPCKKHSRKTKEINEFASNLVYTRLQIRQLKIINGSNLYKELQTPQNPEYRFKHLSEASIG